MGVSIERWENPPPAAEKACEDLKTKFGEAIGVKIFFRGETTILVELSAIVDACRYLKEDPGHAFTMLIDLCGTHYMDQDYEYEVDYYLHSFKHNARLRLKLRLHETNHAPTITDVWATAGWHEREAFDLVGIIFDGHPDLRRILMPEDFEFHPLRRDFPLEGHGA